MPARREESDGLNPLCEGNPLARELARLTPTAPRFNRDSLLYAAGAAARSASVTRWRLTAAAALLAAVGSWGYVAFLPDVTAPSPSANEPSAKSSPAPDTKPIAPQPVESDPPAHIVLFVEDANPGDRMKGLRLRNDILAGGLGLIPSTNRSEAAERTTLAELERSLGLPAGTFAAPAVTKFQTKDPD